MLNALAALLMGSASPQGAPPPPPPATVAVTFDRAGILPVLAEGLADKAARRKATADSPVRIASVSKLASALGVMRLVDAGLLDLDRDVSDYLGWRLRNPAFPDTPITLRLLLSHRSSLTDGGERYIVPLGETLRARLGDPALWDAAHPPGAAFRYANFNFPVVASVMEAATGERFDRLMTRLVFRPLKLDACLNWSGCPDRAIRRAVVLYGADGAVLRDDLHGKAPACIVVAAADGSCDLSAYRPGDNGALYSPQGGVRISMRDLARIGRVLANRGRGFLSPAAFAELIGPQWRGAGLDESAEPSGLFCAYGLAVHWIGTRAPGCRDDLFGDGKPRLGHSGEAYGLRSGLWLDPVSGRGVAFFTTEVADGAAKGPSGFTTAEERVARMAFR